MNYPTGAIGPLGGAQHTNAIGLRQIRPLTQLLVEAIDFSAICVAGWLAFQLRFATPSSFAVPGPQEQFLILVVAFVAALFMGKVYRMWRGGALAAMVARVSLGWLLTWVLLLMFLVMTKSAETFSRIWLLTWLPAGFVMLWAGRVLAFFVMARLCQAGLQLRRILLVGDSAMAGMVRRRVAGSACSGYEIVDTVVPGDGRSLADVERQLKPDEVWISLEGSDQQHVDATLNQLQHTLADIRLVPDLFMYRMLNHGISVTVGIPMVDVSVSPMRGTQKLFKDLLDGCFAFAVLTLLSPLMLAIALGVKLSSPGPVLFKQRRHGWNGEEIWIYKFRSMTVHRESDGVVTQAQRNDARVTPFGRFLRKTSLDELPQFINVLQGRMSVVGPRPHALEHNTFYRQHIPGYMLRHKTKPGITGWSQVCGHRGETETMDKMEERIKHDLFYLQHWSLWMDIKIIVLTPFALLQSRNAY